MSNQSVLVSLLQNVKTVAVIFKGNSSKQYTYKVPEGVELAIGDYAVVDSPIDGLVVVQVTKVHDEADIDFEATFKYKWVIAKVDLAAYKDLLDKEAEMEVELKKLRRKAAVKKQIKNLIGELDGEELPASLQALKEWL